MTQEKYMLIFSLGPVQAFIAQARKTRDLWLGSFLLSKLMEAAMEGINPSVFVFPTDQTVEGWIPDLPNKYIAIFDTPDSAQKAARQSELQIGSKWKTICEQIGREILRKYYNPETETREIWDRQTNFRSFFEIFWVIAAGSEDEYPKWLKATQSAHDARKRLRNFSAQDEPGEKSTISGERETLRGKDPWRKAVQKFWRELTINQSLNDISKDGSERLDAIDTIKRFAFHSSELKPRDLEGEESKSDEIVFPSTSSIATVPFVVKLLTSDISDMDLVLKQWDQATHPELAYSSYSNSIPYLQELERQRHEGQWKWILQRDGDCYFPEAFAARYLKENYGITLDPEEKKREPNLKLKLKDQVFVQTCINALKGLYRAVGSQPTPYYALIQMDGDKMGTLLSGVKNKGEHQNISKALSHFARQVVPKIIQKEQPGRLVYAGGDDVLAFTPLYRILDMVDNLQKQYKEEIRGQIREEDREKVTASIGIAIAHHFTPLSVVRRAASEAEKLAKNRYGRNALVITILRRSGEQTRVGCHWYYANLDIKPIELFKNFYQYFVSGQLSPKSVHVLLDEAPTLIGLEKDAQISEIKRVLKRQRNDQKTTDREEKKLAALDELARQVVQIGCAMDEANLQNTKKENLSTELHADVLRYGLIEVFGWLLVMAFLAREGLEG